MRKMVLAIAAFGAVMVSHAAGAQTYDPNYPVCLKVYGPVTYNECNYTSLQQCQLSASGRAAQCIVNPFAAQAAMGPARAHKRRQVRVY